MTKAVKWQIATALLLVFLAGIATGVFATVHHARRAMFMRQPMRLGVRMSEHMRRELRLSDEQFDAIRPIIDRAASQLESIRAETTRRVDETMRQSHADIAPHLTAEQKVRLDQMHMRHRAALHMHGPPPDGAP
jgi:Spy/CpxP family protein refolding chaperone